MALLTSQTVTPEGITPAAGAAVSASDTVDVSALGTYGWIEFLGGAGSDTITIVDSSKSAAGNVAVGDTIVLPSGSSNRRVVRLPRELADSNSIITITHSAPTGVVYSLFRLA
jgi:hypothetical protein